MHTSAFLEGRCTQTGQGDIHVHTSITPANAYAARLLGVSAGKGSLGSAHRGHDTGPHSVHAGKQRGFEGEGGVGEGSRETLSGWPRGTQTRCLYVPTVRHSCKCQAQGARTWVCGGGGGGGGGGVGIGGKRPVTCYLENEFRARAHSAGRCVGVAKAHIAPSSSSSSQRWGLGREKEEKKNMRARLRLVGDACLWESPRRTASCSKRPTRWRNCSVCVCGGK